MHIIKKASMPMFVLMLLLLVFISNLNADAASGKRMVVDSFPNFLVGTFSDDYNIKYTITDTLWIQQPDVKYHILKCNAPSQYIIAKNDMRNPSEPGLYTRIDYMLFSNMTPYLWGFCLTSYNAISDSVAEAAADADRQNPKKGCNGFPFSRMKKTPAK